MFALLGDIMIGVDVLTGPTGANESEKATFAKLNVAEGRPVVQDRGDDLSVRKMHFFFDEYFCDPASELARLEAARASRSPLPFVAGDGTFTGKRYVIESIDVAIKKTAPSGRLVRVEANLSLLEFPILDLVSFGMRFARLLAPALTAAAGLNVKVKS